MDIIKKHTVDKNNVPFSYLCVQDDNGKVLFTNYPEAGFANSSLQDASCLLIMQCLHLGFITCKNNENLKFFNLENVDGKQNLTEVLRVTKESIEIRDDKDCNNKFEQIFKEDNIKQ